MNKKIILKTLTLSMILSTCMFLQSCKAKEESTATDEAAVVVDDAPAVVTDSPMVVVDSPETGDKPLTLPLEKKP